MKAWILVIGFFVVPLASFAKPVVCMKKMSDGSVVNVSIEGLLNSANSKAHVEILDESGQQIISLTYKKIQNVWDGHASGLASAKGFSFLYNNWYGCIKNAVLTTHLNVDSNGNPTNIGTIEFEACSGGTTEDRLCLP